MAKRIVVALGGNALGNTPEEQLNLVRETAKTIVDLSEAGYEVIVGHGNGPQVGMINLAMEFSSTKGGNTPFMPFPECGAMSQGYIGYHLQQAIQQELKARHIDKECASVITQVVVDEKDPGFANPTKPVGSLYEGRSGQDRCRKGLHLCRRCGTWLSPCGTVSDSEADRRTEGRGAAGQGRRYRHHRRWRRHSGCGNAEWSERGCSCH